MRVLRPALPATVAAAAFAAGFASPAMAHDKRADRDVPSWQADRYSQYGMSEEARQAWLDDCRRRIGHHDSGLGGAAIGGVIGGVAGNRIAGKGNRTAGTIAGAAVGAAAGMAIDKAEDRHDARDQCEAYLDDYVARYNAGYGGYGYGYPGYAYSSGYGYTGYPAGGPCCQPMIMVPVIRQPVGEPQCTETVEYEYVDEPVRAAPPRPVPQKRVKVVPDKRVKVAPDKRLQVK